MKAYLPLTNFGQIVLIAGEYPPAQAGFAIADLSPDQESAVLAGNAFWTPELDEDGVPTGNGTLSAPPPQVPRAIANWRAKAVIEMQGLTAKIITALAAMEGETGIAARAAWSGNADFARDGVTVTTLATALDLTPAQLDAMFIQAAALEV